MELEFQPSEGFNSSEFDVLQAAATSNSADKENVKRDHYLVIGGGGFLGQSMTDFLLKQSPKPLVSIFDLRAPKEENKLLEEVIVGDITNIHAVQAAVSGKTVVIHMASPIHGLDSSIYIKVNVQGTRNVIEACKKMRVLKLVYTSSAGVIYNGQPLYGANEEDPYCSVHMDAYNETKALAEELVLKANDPLGLLTCAIRPSGIFGPKDTQGSLAIVQSAAKGQWKVMIGNNENLFDLTYVDNASYAHYLAATKLKPNSGIDGQAFIITNDQPIFFWDYPKILFHHLGYRKTHSFCLPTPVAYFLGYLMDFTTWLLSPIKTIHPTITKFRVQVITGNRYFNIAKAKERLGYTPVVGLMEGFKRTADYWKTQGFYCRD